MQHWFVMEVSIIILAGWQCYPSPLGSSFFEHFLTWSSLHRGPPGCWPSSPSPPPTSAWSCSTGRCLSTPPTSGPLASPPSPTSSSLASSWPPPLTSSTLPLTRRTLYSLLCQRCQRWPTLSFTHRFLSGKLFFLSLTPALDAFFQSTPFFSVSGWFSCAASPRVWSYPQHTRLSFSSFLFSFRYDTTESQAMDSLQRTYLFIFFIFTFCFKGLGIWWSIYNGEVSVCLSVYALLLIFCPPLPPFVGKIIFAGDFCCWFF